VAKAASWDFFEIRDWGGGGPRSVTWANRLVPQNLSGNRTLYCQDLKLKTSKHRTRELLA